MKHNPMNNKAHNNHIPTHNKVMSLNKSNKNLIICNGNKKRSNSNLNNFPMVWFSNNDNSWNSNVRILTVRRDYRATRNDTCPKTNLMMTTINTVLRKCLSTDVRLKKYHKSLNPQGKNLSTHDLSNMRVFTTVTWRWKVSTSFLKSNNNRSTK